MEMLGKQKLGFANSKWIARNRSELIIGLTVAALATLYFLYFKKKGKRKHPGNKVVEPSLNTEKYVFEVGTAGGVKEVTVEGSGNLYTVSFDGEIIGRMWQDKDRQWKTEEEILQSYISDIAAKISGSFSRQGFPSLLKGAYPEIAYTQWKTSETLEVVLFSGTDIEVFSTFLQDEVQNIVDFQEHLDLLVKNEDDAYFKIVSIN
jgi:hypothetical protein